MKKTLFYLCCLISTLVTAKPITISGFIQDAGSGERLIGVNVFVPGTTLGASTNTYGFYSLTVDVPNDSITVAISYLGYQQQRFKLLNNQNHIVDVTLSQSSQTLDEAVVIAEEIQAQRTEMSTFKLTAKEIKQIPAFLGEVDVIRVLQLLPGVQSGGEGTTGFYVRGGSPDQNLILLDGVPVYNASHLFGFFSVFNADAIKNVQLTKGGFPARFSGRLSSVLEIDLKEGNLKEFHGEGSIGLIASKFTFEGPIIKDKTSFIVSGRRTYYDLLVRPFLPQGIDGGYYFNDLNIKLNHNFSRKDRLYVSFYTGLDKFFVKDNNTFDGETDEFSTFLKWGNYTGSTRWNHLFSDKLFSNFTASYTQYKFAVGADSKTVSNGIESNSGFEFSSLIRDYGLRYDLDYVIDSRHTLKFGGQYTYHIFQPGVAQIQNNFNGESVDSLLNLSTPIYSNEMVAYVEDSWTVTDKLKVNYGLNYSVYAVQNSVYNSLQPRFSSRYLLRDDWSLKASYAYMNQFIHLLSNNGIGLPTDLWVSSTDQVKPQRSQQIALGTTRNIQGNMYEFSVETYYKWMSNLIAYKDGASFLSTTDWQNTIESDGKGEAYGAEFLARKNKGKLTGWIGYTLAWSNRRFDNINQGQVYPYKYDRRHDISVVANYKVSDKFDFGAVWVYGTGNTFTAPLANFFLEGVSGNFGGRSDVSQVQRFSDRNGLRLPAYHRLDVGFNFHKKTTWGQRTWNVSFYNAYSRQNPYFLYIDETSSGKQVKQVSLFPIIPSISYSFKF